MVQQDARKFVVEKGKTLPEIDMTANYEIRNKTFGPITITITNASRDQMQSMTIGARGKVTIPGNRMTDFVFELETRGLLKTMKV